MSVIDMPPRTTAYPEHDHSSKGPGNPTAHQLGQEEVYIALRGSADLEVDGYRYPVDVGHIIRIGPTARCKILPGPMASGCWRSAACLARRTTPPPPSEWPSADGDRHQEKQWTSCDTCECVVGWLGAAGGSKCYVRQSEGFVKEFVLPDKWLGGMGLVTGRPAGFSGGGGP